MARLTPVPRSRLLRTLALGLLALVAPATSLTATVGCHACNADVCVTRLFVTITEPGGGPLQEGEYLVELTLDGTPTSAICAVGPGGATASCSGPGAEALSTPVYDSPDNPHETLVLDWVDPVPRTLVIHIEHDGVVVLDASLEPDYEPVDEVCDPGCESASEDLALDRG